MACSAPPARPCAPGSALRLPLAQQLRAALPSPRLPCLDRLLTRAPRLLAAPACRTKHVADPFGYNLLTVLGAEERTPTL